MVLCYDFVDIYIVLCAPVMYCTGYKLLWPALSTYYAISTNNIQKVLWSYIHSFTFMRPISVEYKSRPDLNFLSKNLGHAHPFCFCAKLCIQ